MKAQHTGTSTSGGPLSFPLDLLGQLLFSPVVCIVLGITVAVVVVVIRRTAGSASGPVASKPRRERIAIAGVALAAGLSWITDIALRGSVFDMSATVSWWRFAVAPTAAAAGLTALAVVMRAEAPRRVVDSATAGRRTWTTFGPRRGIPVFLVLAGVAVAVTLVFGDMSTASDPGLAAHVALELPNTDAPPVVLPFPGWAYGIPLIVSVSALAAILVLVLGRNALRPFPAGVPLDVERGRRAMVARDATALATAATLLATAGALRLARSAVVTTVTTMTGSGTGPAQSVNLPHADLIMVGGAIAPVAEIVGCALLALLVVGGARAARAPLGRTVAWTGVSG